MKIIGTIIKKLLQTLFLWLFGYLAISALHDKQWLWLCVFGYISIHLFGFLLGICHFKTKEERDANRASKKELKPPTISIHQIVTIGGKTVVTDLAGVTPTPYVPLYEESEAIYGESREGDYSEMVTHPKYGFFVGYNYSPNRQFKLCWRDGNDEKNGAYMLLKDNQAVAHGTFARPNDGKVADNGNFVFNDWCHANELTGIFRAFNVRGEVLLTERFKANLLNNGLSSDGRYAACHTCNAYEDAGILAVFDLENRSLIAKWQAESGWPDFFEFPELGVIALGYRRLGIFRYTHQGEFLDHEAHFEACLKQKNPTRVVWFISQRLKEKANLTPDIIARLNEASAQAVGKVKETDVKNLVEAHKVHGKCLDAAGAFAEAIVAYEKALALDPKAGVKQRVGQLRKRIAPTAPKGSVSTRLTVVMQKDDPVAPEP